MGHATVTNITERFLKQMVSKGSVSMAEVADDLVRRGETLSASECDYDERYMLLFGLEQVVDWYRRIDSLGQPFNEPVIIPHELTPAQQQMLLEWDTDQAADDRSWTDAWTEERQALLDSIRWKFAPGWRARYQYHKVLFPILNHVTN